MKNLRYEIERLNPLTLRGKGCYDVGIRYQVVAVGEGKRRHLAYATTRPVAETIAEALNSLLDTPVAAATAA